MLRYVEIGDVLPKPPKEEIDVPAVRKLLNEIRDVVQDYMIK